MAFPSSLWVRKGLQGTQEDISCFLRIANYFWGFSSVLSSLANGGGPDAGSLSERLAISNAIKSISSSVAPVEAVSPLCVMVCCLGLFIAFSPVAGTHRRLSVAAIWDDTAEANFV